MAIVAAARHKPRVQSTYVATGAAHAHAESARQRAARVREVPTHGYDLTRTCTTMKSEEDDLGASI